MDKQTVDGLVREFRQVLRFPEPLARRSAFCVLAYHQGWSAARMGRYLGVSRARVGQRIEKLRRYAQTQEEMPILARLVTEAAKPEPSPAGQDLPVAFPAAQWDDEEFSRGVISQLAAAA